MLLQDESADSSLVILGAVLRGKTVLALTQNDGLFVWYVLQHVYSNSYYWAFKIAFSAHPVGQQMNFIYYIIY